MSDANSAANLEQSWLAWLDQRNEQIVNYLNSWNLTRALTPAELRGIVSALDQHLQELNNARQAAGELSRQGTPDFAQRLDAAIQGMRGTRNTYQQMYVSTAATQAQIAQIMQSTNQAKAQIYGQITSNMRNARIQNHQEYITPIGIPGGGYCARCGPRPG